MDDRITRRAVVNRGLSATALIPILGMLGIRAALAAAPMLATGDPVAKSLGYVTQSAKPGAKCSNCVQYHGAALDAAGACTIFPGKSVAAAGWCISWAKVPPVAA